MSFARDVMVDKNTLLIEGTIALVGILLGVGLIVFRNQIIAHYKRHVESRTWLIPLRINYGLLKVVLVVFASAWIVALVAATLLALPPATPPV